ncbi:hypothetical protein, partial [Candidatus Thiosymbion oneisti]|uniref:hypothetical protein n=1 Tax=Candidatus Thiosymbion oneisti TaxID=589554 RepID=UPI001A9C7A16
ISSTTHKSRRKAGFFKVPEKSESSFASYMTFFMLLSLGVFFVSGGYLLYIGPEPPGLSISMSDPGLLIRS